MGQFVNSEFTFTNVKRFSTRFRQDHGCRSMSKMLRAEGQNIARRDRLHVELEEIMRILTDAGGSKCISTSGQLEEDCASLQTAISSPCTGIL